MKPWRLVALGVVLLAVGLGAGVWVVRGPASSSAPETSQLPPGHPPLPAPGSVPSVAPPPAESGTGAQALTWTAPSGWVAEPPRSPMRRAQYRIDGPGGPAECVVFYFGPGQGGDPAANVARWVSQFQGPDGAPLGNAQAWREIKVDDIPVTIVEIRGAYVGGMGGGPADAPKPDYMLLGAIAQGPDAPWFFRATGPRATLEKQRPAFERMVQSFRRGG